MEKLEGAQGRLGPGEKARVTLSPQHRPLADTNVTVAVTAAAPEVALLRLNCAFNARAGTYSANLPPVRVRSKPPLGWDSTQGLGFCARSDMKSQARLLAGNGFDDEGRFSCALIVFVTAISVPPRANAYTLVSAQHSLWSRAGPAMPNSLRAATTRVMKAYSGALVS